MGPVDAVAISVTRRGRKGEQALAPTRQQRKTVGRAETRRSTTFWATTPPA
jgi:hypothetical protein